MTVFAFNIFILIIEIPLLFYIAQAKKHAVSLSILFGILVIMTGFMSPFIFFGRDFFGVVQLWVWTFFLHGPIYFTGLSIIFLPRSKTGSIICFSIVPIVVSVWAYSYSRDFRSRGEHRQPTSMGKDIFRNRGSPLRENYGIF